VLVHEPKVIKVDKVSQKSI